MSKFKLNLSSLTEDVSRGLKTISEAVRLIEQPHILKGGACNQGHPHSFVDMFMERSNLSQEERKKWFYGKKYILAYCVVGDHFYLKDLEGENHRELTNEEIGQVEDSMRKAFVAAAKAGREIYAVNYSGVSKDKFPENERIEPLEV